MDLQLSGSMLIRASDCTVIFFCKLQIQNLLFPLKFRRIVLVCLTIVGLMVTGLRYIYTCSVFTKKIFSEVVTDVVNLRIIE